MLVKNSWQMTDYDNLLFINIYRTNFRTHVKEHTDLTPGYELGHPSLKQYAVINKRITDTL
jgi:hypothetical protein